MNARASLGLSALLLALGAVAACSSSDASSDVAGGSFAAPHDGVGGGSHVGTTTGTTSATWGAGGSGQGGSAATTTSTTTTSAGGAAPTTSAGGAGGAGGADACAGLDQSKPLTLYLSADDSNSMGSPVYAREMLKLGRAPYAGVRTYEFLNYYRIAYAAPQKPNLAILPELAEGSQKGDLDLSIGIRSYDAIHPRRPMTITFVLDTSGSMGGYGIARERAAVKAIASQLAEGDVVSMVLWNTDQAVVLSGHAATGPNDPTVVAAADALNADGSTDLSNGLKTGYSLAQKHYGAQRLNRVILVSDGGANVGVTDGDLIGASSKDADKEGIYLVGVGTGPAENYNDGLMDIVTDKGRGAYVYLDGPAEAARVLGERFDEVMEVAARGVQVELVVPWYLQMVKFSGEEYSQNPEEVEPQHLAPSDAMVFDQVLRACDPALVNPEDTVKVTARWQEPMTREKMETSVEVKVGDLLAGPTGHLRKAKAIVAYAEALKTGEQATLHAAHDLVVAANEGGTDPELTEIAGLVALHPNY
jgi:Ca-activated chloride channel family protein